MATNGIKVAKALDLRQMHIDEAGNGKCGSGPQWCVRSYPGIVNVDTTLPQADRDAGDTIRALMSAEWGTQQTKLARWTDNGRLTLSGEATPEGPLLRLTEHNVAAHVSGRGNEGTSFEQEAIGAAFLDAISDIQEPTWAPGLFAFEAADCDAYEELQAAADALWNRWLDLIDPTNLGLTWNESASAFRLAGLD